MTEENFLVRGMTPFFKRFIKPKKVPRFLERVPNPHCCTVWPNLKDKRYFRDDVFSEVSHTDWEPENMLRLLQSSGMSNSIYALTPDSDDLEMLTIEDTIDKIFSSCRLIAYCKTSKLGLLLTPDGDLYILRR